MKRLFPGRSYQTQWAAQFLAAAELVRRGYTVSFTMGNSTPIADLMVGTSHGKQFWVDVKGLRAKNDWLMKPKADHENLYYILVLLSDLAMQGNTREPDQFYVMSQAEANRLEQEYRSDRPNNKTTMPGFTFRAAAHCRDNWNVLPPV